MSTTSTIQSLTITKTNRFVRPTTTSITFTFPTTTSSFAAGSAKHSGRFERPSRRLDFGATSVHVRPFHRPAWPSRKCIITTTGRNTATISSATFHFGSYRTESTFMVHRWHHCHHLNRRQHTDFRNTNHRHSDYHLYIEKCKHLFDRFGLLATCSHSSICDHFFIIVINFGRVIHFVVFISLLRTVAYCASTSSSSSLS